ncbi:MAG: hypothetical protein C0601_07565 [Candidatus Muiribacterium halophilum]|uniref:Uncharacterized protein n=1 Tax=Muiribacterium halophilum TaxID=2053465 RepID=A0A2N5ZFJ7_MUIH1|nr:MAG: hypothetical protein C0601_07565 [Candidatus Muirbacterium halophilum]
MYITYLRPDIEDKTILLYLTLKVNTHLKKITLSNIEDYDVDIFPMSFPVNNFKIIISGDFKEEILQMFIYLENGDIFSESFFVEEKQISFADHLYIEKEFEMVNQKKIDERKQFAVELLLSDEGFMTQLQENFGDPEEILDKATIMAEKVAEKTVNIINDDEANQYINYNVVAGPDSVMKQILQQ